MAQLSRVGKVQLLTGGAGEVEPVAGRVKIVQGAMAAPA